MSGAALTPTLVRALDLALEPYRHCRRWWLACSGGVDSTVLLHATATLTRAAPGHWPALGVIHVNHQLNPHAAQWAQHVQAQCDALEIPCLIKIVDVDRSRGDGVEAAARSVRYAAFNTVVGSDELLLQAHHCDDQVETFFLRLLRGSGIAGLSAIPATRALGQGQGRLLRPLLAITRREIIAYAEAHGLQWVEDSSNADTRFERNFLRRNVLPLLERRWPFYRDTIARAIDHVTETQALLQEYAAQDLLALLHADGSLETGGLMQQSTARQRLLLRTWLQRQGFALPSRAQLDEVLAMSVAGADAEPCVRWADVEVRRFQLRLHALQSLPVLPGDFDLPWQPGQALILPQGCGVLTAIPQNGAGLRMDRTYHVRNRRGGERCHPLRRMHSQTLKKLLQEAQLPPWWRDRMPLIFCGNEIAAVGDLWICRGFQADPTAQGWLPLWQRTVSNFAGSSLAATLNHCE